ncbi:MAG: alkaline phosphatase D family protein [Planctomycetota bacterium]|jgi:phosphodiesterase/alkaline phosphatase D-like protein
MLAACLLLSLACDSGAPPPRSTPEVAQRPVGSQEFHADWSGSVERCWIGPHYWANRLQDWRLADGRLECVEGANRFPIRTLHLLTRSAGPQPGTIVMSVRTGSVHSREQGDTRGWSGFLIGAGGEHVDYRLTALVHHRPAADGGLLAVVDASGRVSFRENSRSSAGGGLWSIAGPIEDGDVPVVASSDSGERSNDDWPGVIDLTLTVRPAGEAYRLELAAHRGDTGALLGEAMLEGVSPGQVDGGLALVSHLGPQSGGGHWFRNWRIAGTKVHRQDGRSFGPVLCVQYTLGRGELNLAAQMGPLGPDDSRSAALEVREASGDWRTVAVSTLAPDSFTFDFKVRDWNATSDRAYRIRYDLALADQRSEVFLHEGTIRREPVDADEFVVASLNCHKIYTGGLQWNHDGIWFPHAELIRAVRGHEPDLLFFAGDQIYEGDLDPAQTRPEEKARLDYLYKWYRWCWAFGELTRDIPTVTIPDDHDVYHGNLWGAGGRRARAREGVTAQDSGGYKMSPRFVNAVHRTQTSHLPDPVNAPPIGAGYSVYYTRLDYGGVSFAILADRQFKSAPTITVPDGRIVNGWIQNPDFDPADADVPGAVLLGDDQLSMLRAWALDWPGRTWMKVALSQTLFANVATLPPGAKSGSVIPSIPVRPPDDFPDDYVLAADADSNGWPPSGRDRALRELRRAFAIHLAGDQHLGSLIQYGIDDWRDAAFAFCAPAIANTWPRRWFPSFPGENREAGAPPYTGDYRDGFGNLMTVYAAANPVDSGREPAKLHDRAPGYGIVRLHRESRRITFECWPRWAGPTDPDAHQYAGWPRTISQLDNGPRAVAGWLPTVHVPGAAGFVVQVIDETSGLPEYAFSAPGDRFRPMAYGAGPYTLEVSEPGTGRFRRWPGLVPAVEMQRELRVEW